MKKIIILINILISGQLATAQIATIKSIDSGGESTTGNVQAVYTIGETGIVEYSGTSLKVSEGFINDISVEGSLSLEENTLKVTVKPYPNPTQDYIHIEYPNLVKVTYLLVDSTGKVVMQQQANSKKHQLSISQLPAGIYFVKATSNSQNIGTFKIVKQ